MSAARIKHVTAHLASDSDPAANAKRDWDQIMENGKANKLEGKVCIVTGAGSEQGIGRAAVIQMAQAGCTVVIATDLEHGMQNLLSLKKLVESQYPFTRCMVRAVDASNESHIKNLCEYAMKEFSRLDVFFANAAIVGTPAIFDHISVENFEKTLKINVISVFLAIKYASHFMKITSKDKPESKGSIVATASVAGIRSGAGSMDYSASKAAVINMAATAAWQLAGTGIRVNALCPGLIKTNMTAPTFDLARERKTTSKLGQLNPTRRYGLPEEMASVAIFLCSDESSYVNGAAFVADGGLSSSHPVVPGKIA
jgi:NAD(P)-dependent dehydrogenase (short-subunit alcohol dehydrogenase family)